MSNNILFIFEGEKEEQRVYKNLTKHFLNKNAIITCAYCSTIYDLYQKHKEDDDLDTFSILKERKQNANILKNYVPEDFSEIYMFFDYDGHAPIASDDKLKDLLDTFNNETGKGKLYISYPMIESLKHFSKGVFFKFTNVECKKNIKYKKLVNKVCQYRYIDYNQYRKKTWQFILLNHLKKANFIVSKNYKYPEVLITQKEIFVNQKVKFIDPSSEVAVLNSFPLFLFEYYGINNFKTLLK
ncbi:hypothetical protein HX063_11580 [Myroides odoratimimus]|uniref:hypothetical protein n=1 Tax=Myroides odoratimimus TaxID=76832 RepID=UPI002576B764|nr:hypothetical protein [Myroides odoratimimus]MDM1496047.1 hypothetical protein [Myroides odoratimimus]